MPIQLDELLQPVSVDAPCGANLEYDPEFLELERAAQGKPEQQLGNVVTPAEPPDYKDLSKRATALLKRSKDLRIANLLLIGAVYLEGFTGLADGLTLIARLLGDFWVTIHPEVEPNDDTDPSRSNALSGLCSAQFLGALRDAPLVASRNFGRVSLNDVNLAAEAAPAVQRKLDSTAIEAAFQDAGSQAVEGIHERLERSLEAVKEIDNVFTKNNGRGIDFTPLVQLLTTALRAVKLRLGNGEAGLAETEGSNDAAGSLELGTARPSGRSSASGEIASRDDVVRALDKICAYYARYEPSSPLPMLLMRCKRLVSKSFMDIIKDLSPDSLTQVELIAGKTEE